MTDNSFEKAYTAIDMSDLLDIGKSTLRKWCLSLEENGYQFTKDKHQRRLFVDNDVVALKHFKQLVKIGNMSLQSASYTIISRFHSDAFASGTPSVPEADENQQRSLERSHEVINQLVTRLDEQDKFIEEQREFNRELIKKLDNYENALDQRLKERDKKLMDTLNQLQETKKVEQAKKENKIEPEAKKGFFSRLFRL